MTSSEVNRHGLIMNSVYQAHSNYIITGTAFHTVPLSCSLEHDYAHLPTNSCDVMSSFSTKKTYMEQRVRKKKIYKYKETMSTLRIQLRGLNSCIPCRDELGP